MFDARAKLLWLSTTGLQVLPFLVLGLVLLFGRRHIVPLYASARYYSPIIKSKIGYYAFAGAMTAFACFFEIMVFSAAYRAEQTYREAYRTGAVMTVEGEVMDFVPESDEDGIDERFTVDGTTFAYSAFRIDGGFNRSREVDGPMRNGLWVRVDYLDVGFKRKIIRLEVRR